MNNNGFNRFTNLEGLEWRIINHLIQSESVHAEKLWKMLRYPDINCLFKENITKKDKRTLVYRDNGESSSKRVFLMPYVDDAWTEQGSRLDVFVDKIVPENHLISRVNVRFEILVHNKVNNIYGEAEEGNPASNPSEIDEDGNILIPTKSRATTMLKCLLASLNGAEVAGVGQLQFNKYQGLENAVEKSVWNNHQYVGYSFTMGILMAGVSDSEYAGW